MEVYFNGNFWGRGGKKEQAGTEIKVQREFAWGAEKGIILSVYQCEEGFVVDCCFHRERELIKEYYDKWDEKARTGRLTDEERERIEQENPFQMHFRAYAVMNRREVGSDGMCSISWRPSGIGTEIMEEESEELMEHYQCSRDCGWLFIRISFPWIGRSGLAGQNLQLKLEELPIPHTAGCFCTDMSSIGTRITAEHPVSGRPYTIIICGYEQEKIQWDESEVNMGMEFPVYYQVLSYKTEPDYPAEQFYIQDCDASDQPRLKKEENICADGSRGVSIIGGTDGPMSIFLAGKEKHVPCVHQAYSAVHFKQTEKVDWKMVFYEKEREDLWVNVI